MLNLFNRGKAERRGQKGVPSVSFADDRDMAAG